MFDCNEPQIKGAIEFANRWHGNQTRKYTGAPYVVGHCIPVAKLVAAKGGDEDTVIAAILHDVLEDTECTQKRLIDTFGEIVAQLVYAVTDQYTPEKWPDTNRTDRKRAEARRYKNIDVRAKLIKLCDIEHNVSSIIEHDPGFAVTYLREKADELEALI